MIFRDTPLRERVATWTVQALSRVLASYALVQGLNLIIGGHQRFSASHFTVARLLPLAPASWGTMLAAFGVFALIGSLADQRLLIRLGHRLSAVWCLFFSITFVLSAYRNPTAATSVIFSYLFLALCYLVVASAYREKFRHGPR